LKKRFVNSENILKDNDKVMTSSMMAKRISYGLLPAAALCLIMTTGFSTAASAQSAGQPTLVITNDPLPPDLHSRVYSKPNVAPVVDANVMTGPAYYDNVETIVGRKVEQLRGELFALQGDVSGLSESLVQLEGQAEVIAAEYYGNVGTISTQLQSGTTPGNPRLVQRLAMSQANLEGLANNVARLNEVALEVSRVASLANYLLETVRASYSLSGAIEEDHVRLSELEDAINNTLVVIDRLLNNVNDDITRTATYLSTERSNLRTLALAITQGDLYGKSLSNRPFSGISPASFTPGELKRATPPSPRPLVKIRFNKQDVSYEQPVYVAVSQAMERYPAARFELVAVHPAGGNAAEVAIESTRARRNAEKVLRTLTQMGLPLERIDMSYTPSSEAATSEVHIYIR
jgi:hypothetical protein